MRAEEQTAARYWMKMLLLPEAETGSSEIKFKTPEPESFRMLPESHRLQPYLKRIKDH